MKITEVAYQKLNRLISDEPPETGGILGSADGETITEVILDQPSHPPDRFCTYAPNVEFLNARIAEWQQKGIRFMGIFHTHFGGATKLSDADKEYITAIMQAIPEEITFLYFPLYVLPDRALVIYRSNRIGQVYMEQLDFVKGKAVIMDLNK